MSRLLGALALFLVACAEPPTPRPVPRADKQRIFGDAALVPTREGERARRELALAGEIAHALERRPEVESAHVDVELAREPPGVLVALTLRSEADRTEIEAEVDRASTAIVGADASVTRIVGVAPAAPAPLRGVPWPLALALVGLGVSAGIGLERWRTGRTVRSLRRR
jgi:hypothetical protein